MIYQVRMNGRIHVVGFYVDTKWVTSGEYLRADIAHAQAERLNQAVNFFRRQARDQATPGDLPQPEQQALSL